MLTKLENRVINRKVFITALLFGLVVGAIDGYRVQLPLMLLHRQNVPFAKVGTYLSVLSMVSDLLIPTLMFASLYLLGKGIDLRDTYGRVSASLLIGSVLGGFSGFVSGYLITPYGWENWTSGFAIASTRSLLHMIRLFFLGFTALALAYLRNREGPSEGVR